MRIQVINVHDMREIFLPENVVGHVAAQVQTNVSEQLILQSKYDPDQETQTTTQHTSTSAHQCTAHRFCSSSTQVA